MIFCQKKKKEEDYPTNLQGLVDFLLKYIFLYLKHIFTYN